MKKRSKHEQKENPSFFLLLRAVAPHTRTRIQPEVVGRCTKGGGEAILNRSSFAEDAEGITVPSAHTHTGTSTNNCRGQQQQHRSDKSRCSRTRDTHPAKNNGSNSTPSQTRTAQREKSTVKALSAPIKKKKRKEIQSEVGSGNAEKANGKRAEVYAHQEQRRK